VYTGANTVFKQQT